MNVFTDLRARPYGRPCVYHGAFIHIRADINVGGHQYGITSDIRALAHCRRRHYSKTLFLETGLVVIGEFHRDFIEVAAFRTVDNLIVIDAKRKQHRFFQPLMRHPLTVNLLRHAQTTCIEKSDNLIYRFTGYGIHISGGNVGATLESGFNNVL